MAAAAFAARVGIGGGLGPDPSGPLCRAGNPTIP